jgi:hypothetical protein
MRKQFWEQEIGKKKRSLTEIGQKKKAYILNERWIAKWIGRIVA